MIKPVIKLNGWQTIKDFATSKGWATDKYVYELIARNKVASIKLPELNNITLVKAK